MLEDLHPKSAMSLSQDRVLGENFIQRVRNDFISNLAERGLSTYLRSLRSSLRGYRLRQGSKTPLWWHKVKGVGRRGLEWEGGKHSCCVVVFLEFPGRPDTGSLFLLFSRPLWGQAGHVLPPAEKQLSREPSPIVLSAKGNKERPGLFCLCTEHAWVMNPLPSLGDLSPFSMGGGQSSCHRTLEPLAFFPAALPYTPYHSTPTPAKGPLPAPRHWLSRDQAPGQSGLPLNQNSLPHFLHL